MRHRSTGPDHQGVEACGRRWRGLRCSGVSGSGGGGSGGSSFTGCNGALALLRFGVEREGPLGHHVVSRRDAAVGDGDLIALAGAGLEEHRVVGGAAFHEGQGLAIRIHHRSDRNGDHASGFRGRSGGDPQHGIDLGAGLHLAHVPLLLKLIAMAHVGHGRAEPTEGQASEAEAAGQKKSAHDAAAAGAGQEPAKDDGVAMKNR